MRDELIQQIADNVSQLKRAIQAHVQVTQIKLGLSPAQLEMLRAIHHLQPLSHKALAQHMQLTPGAVTQLIDNLDQAGCIVRTADQADRRISYLSISRDGKRKLDEVRKLRKQVFMQAFSELDESDLEAYLRVQTVLTKWLESQTTTTKK